MHMSSPIQVGETRVGGDAPLLVIGGPCVLETQAQALEIAGVLQEACAESGASFVFKASYDKANRTSIRSGRGPGLAEGLQMLGAIAAETGAATTTDIHEPGHAAAVAEVVDLLQIPAFLCRQTDLLVAAAATGRPVNVKKGQFMSPSEMQHVIDKLEEAECSNIMLTERGTFFGYQRLVNDFVGMGDLMSLGPPVCFDVTHSTQLPGAGTGQTAGRPDRGALLSRSAAAAGVDAIFLECHPDPASAASDSGTMQPLSAVAAIVRDAVAISRIARQQTMGASSVTS